MLGAHPHPRHDRRSDDEGHVELAAGEVVELRRLVEDLVHRHADEVEEFDLDHSPHAADREADSEADGADSQSGRVPDHFLAVVLEEPARDAERAAVRADVLARCIIGSGLSSASSSAG